MNERPTLPATPVLDERIQRLRARIAAQVWLYGLGYTLLAVGGWLLFMFLADWTLHVPAGVRVFHVLLLVALPAYVVRRFLLQPLARIPDRAGLAVLLERAQDRHEELLVSAVQLRESPPAEADPVQLAAVLVRAEERAREADPARVLDASRPRKALFGGLALALVTTTALSARPEVTGTFFARILGGSTPWPQRTHLSVEIPAAAGREVARQQDRVLVRVARGSDVPVLVRAKGVVPDEVILSFDGGQERALAPTGRGLFRTLLPSLQEDLAFRVRGGDDQDGQPEIVIHVLQAPDVSALAIAVEPPAYTGLDTQLYYDQDVEVLAGSRVSVSMLPTPADATGGVRLFPSDRELRLEPRAFPARAQRGESELGLGFELTAEEDLRYRFELVDTDGLANPDPGLFAVHVTPDRTPTVEWISPGRGEVETVPGGSLPVRIRAQDDFGLDSIALLIGDLAEGAKSIALEGRAMEADKRARDARFAALRLEDVDLSPSGEEVVAGQTFQLTVTATDKRGGEVGTGRSSPVRIRVVSADEYLRRVQDRLARVRAQTEAAAEMLREKRERTLELIASIESDQPGDGAGPSDYSAALAGSRRVQGDSEALSRELSSVAEGLLYARLDERAGPLLELLDRAEAERTDRRFHAEVWTELASRQRAEQVGGNGLAGRLVEIVGLSLEISNQELATATEALRRAQESQDLVATHDALLDAADRQAAALTLFDALLEDLAEWDSFQSVLTLTRDLLNRQKILLKRTEHFAKEN
ncbi:MAG: hypothetical protein H6831_15655 [Planctomycetes bacterium]|nr:hypothetical protein [Planctomycetota bacterium]MCB9905834.1 hypothetical protein [Planctomycetota bacterium]